MTNTNTLIRTIFNATSTVKGGNQKAIELFTELTVRKDSILDLINSAIPDTIIHRGNGEIYIERVYNIPEDKGGGQFNISYTIKPNQKYMEVTLNNMKGRYEIKAKVTPKLMKLKEWEVIDF